MTLKRKEDIDLDVVYDLVERGATRQDIAETCDCSTGMLSKRLADIRIKQGLLMEYRTLQTLELTELQAKILDNITEDKIEEASLKDLVYAFKILKDKELVSDGKPNEIKGLVSYLIEMEKQEVINVTPAVSTSKDTITDANTMPNL